MKVADQKTLFARGAIATSREWAEARLVILKAIETIDWPEGSGRFTICPEKEGNGVRLIKKSFVDSLKSAGWKTEAPIKLNSELRAGNLDFALTTSYGQIAIEWETGNVSSCHRSMNKLALGLVEGKIAVGIMIVASRNLYEYLTDRIGNIKELEPYLPFWSAIVCENGVFEVFVFEHDDESIKSPLIPKGTDGMGKAAQERRAQYRINKES